MNGISRRTALAAACLMLAPPDGDVSTIDDLVKKLREFAKGPDVGRTGWIFGLGYDDARLGRHPTREDLDKVSTTIPVIAVHISGHFSAMNSAGLAKVGYTAATKDPEGGVIRRREGSNEPNGVLEELASIPSLVPAINAQKPEDKDYFLKRGLDLAKSCGYTTTNEGRLFTFQHEDLVSASKRGLLDIDVMSCVDYTDRKVITPEWFGKSYKGRYRIAGLKITLDGSPRMFTTGEIFMRSAGFFSLIALAAAGMTSTGHAASPANLADAIYVGGDIVTINDAQPSAEALAVKGGKIIAVGERQAIESKYKGGKTKIVDLAGKALLPGFIDAHSHYFSSLTVANQVNLYAPPAGPGKDVDSILAALQKFRDEHKIPKGVLIQAYGYDENVMPDGRLLNRDDLDKAFPDNPVLVGHVSMHGGVMNSAALKQFNFSANTKTPPGGVIVRKPGTEEPYGLIMETAYLPVFASLPKPTRQQEVEWSIAGQKLYAQAGVTTAHEGATHAEELAVMQRAATSGKYIIDVIAYPFVTELQPILKANPVKGWGKYNQRLKIGGVKVTIDGSPQGRTAFFTTPYLTGGPGGEKDWTGELAAPQEVVNKAVKTVYDLGVPLNLHANGDGAIDAFLKAHEFAAAGDLGKERHVTMIHAQFTRKDQIDKYVEYKITPSFYTLHTYYFAEAHIANRGKEQAMYISPMRDAIDKGLKPTNHTDFVVAPLDQMFMLWSAVNRISRAGAEIGPDQRVTPMEGLKAMTIWSARQHREDDIKGSLEAGKLADLVILDKNPLKVEPMAIKDIQVVETIKEGKTIYARK